MSNDTSLTIASFQGTTQQRYWIFTREKLSEMRAAANKAAAEAVLRNQNSDMLTSPMKKQRTDGTDGGGGGGEGSSEPVQVLTPAEEGVLLDYYLAGLVMQAKKLKFPDSVEATAITFLKRFYLNCSVMDYHPKEIMLTVMWLACKVEHYPHRYIGAEKVMVTTDDNEKEFKFDCRSFAELGKMEASALIRLEHALLHALHYHLMVLHAYRPLRGFVEAWGQLPAHNINPDKLLRKAAKVVREAIRSDVPLLFAPAAVALFALSQAAAEAGADIGALLKHVLPGEQDRVALQATLQDIAASLNHSKPQLKGNELKVEAQKMDAKLQLCRNPEKDRNHPRCQQLEEERKKEKQRKREDKNRKRAEAQREREREVLGLSTD